PRKSHLFSGDTSHMPTPSRTAAYSASASPKDSLQSQPPSSMNVAPRASWTAWNAVVIGSLMVQASSSAARHPRAALPALYPEFEPLFNPPCTARGRPDQVANGGFGPRRPTGGQDQERLGRDQRVVERVVRARDRDPQPAGRRRQCVSVVAAR